MSVWVLVGIAVLIGLAWFAAERIIEQVVVFEFQHGLRFDRGKLTGVVGPGAYWLLRHRSRISILEGRPRLLTISGQEILTADAVSIKISLSLEVEVTDPEAAYMKAADYESILYSRAQNTLRDLVGKVEIQELLRNRNDISAKLSEDLAPVANSLGLDLRSVAVKDVMFPGALKESFSQVARAKQESLAKLERARGDSAAMRKLANTSQMLTDNPSLYKLRLLQILSESDKISVALESPTAEAPAQAHGSD